ncbi:ADP-ribosylation [Trametopsis cervina]|nr:ADP-ribosylation [Trametopsis cervina]
MDEFSLSNPINKNPSRQGRLVFLTRQDPRYTEVIELFKAGWTHPDKNMPYIHGVCKILSPEWLLKPFRDYKASLSNPSFWSPFLTRPQPEVQESLLFHGTTRGCLLAENERNGLLCNLPDCYLCSIIREGFDLQKCGRKNKFSRFGTGIYTSSCSSKADDYCSNTSEKATLRVVLVSRVVVGRTYRLRRNDVKLVAPPWGYNSITGEPGEDLNYEETVVYKNEAIRPAFLVVYGDKPPPPINTHHADRGLKLRSAMRRIFATPLATH